MISDQSSPSQSKFNESDLPKDACIASSNTSNGSKSDLPPFVLKGVHGELMGQDAFKSQVDLPEANPNEGKAKQHALADLRIQAKRGKFVSISVQGENGTPIQDTEAK